VTTPNFWDAFTGSMVRSHENYREDQREKRAKEERDKERERTQKNQDLGLLTELFRSGDIDAGVLNGRLASAGITGGTTQAGGFPGMPAVDVPLPVVQKSKHQRRREALAQGQPFIDQMSDDEKAELGFTTTVEKKIQGAKVAEADVATRRAEALNRFMSGEDIKDEEREVLGVLSRQDRQLQQLAKIDPILGEMGERYVAEQMLTTNGVIPRGGAKAIADAAYNKFIQERAQQFGTMSPEQTEAARTYFSRAVANALIAQKKMELDQFNSQTARIGANASQQRAGASQELQWFGKITGAVESLRKAQNDLMRGSPGLSAALGDPKLAASPLVKDAVERYNVLEQQIEALKGSQAQLANGEIPQNIATAVGAAEQVMAGRNTPQAANDPVVAQAVNLLKTKKGTIPMLQEAVKLGRITQAQYQQIIQQAGTQ
jgi:hypothetical protein